MCCSNRTREGWVLGLVFLGVIVSFGKKRDNLTKKCRNNRTREGWVLGLVFLGVIVSFGKKRDSLTKKCCYKTTGRGRAGSLDSSSWVSSSPLVRKDSLITKKCCSNRIRKVWVLGLVFLGVIVSFGKKRDSPTRICCSKRTKEDLVSLGKKREGLLRICCSSWTRKVHVLPLVYLGIVFSIVKGIVQPFD
jgi:hypothetical protein